MPSPGDTIRSLPVPPSGIPSGFHQGRQQILQSKTPSEDSENEESEAQQADEQGDETQEDAAVEEETSPEEELPVIEEVVEEDTPSEEEVASEPETEQPVSEEPPILGSTKSDVSNRAKAAEKEVVRLSTEVGSLRKSLAGAAQVIEELETEPMPPAVLASDIVVPDHLVCRYCKAFKAVG